MSRPLVIAHRGFSARFPENTTAAFRAAVDVGADGIECDLMITRDDELVIFHDTNLSRLLHAEGRLEDQTWKHLKTMKVFGREPVCHLDSLLELPDNLILNIEVKLSARFKKLSEKLWQKLSKLENPKRVILSTFSPAILFHLYESSGKNFEGRFGLIFERFSERKVRAMQGCPWIHQWNVSVKELLHAPISNRPKDNRPIWCWTSNTPKEWHLLCEAGAQGIFTDEPEELRRYLDTHP